MSQPWYGSIPLDSFIYVNSRKNGDQVNIGNMRSHNWRPRLSRVFLHSTKSPLHSAKALPSVTLGKGFAECSTRQSPLGKFFLSKGSLPSAFYLGTGQSFIYIYIHQSSHLYHQHALYITSTPIFNKSIENPSQMHQSSTS